MAMIPNETVDLVRTTVNIADYIGQYVGLHKKGQNLFGLCPFHEEKTPSFSVSESKQIFECFSCHRGGNVFKFVMEYDHVEFPAAVQKVAEFVNVPLGVEVTSSRPSESAETRRQKELLAAVAEMSHHILMNTEAGAAALDYLTARGLTEETLNHFDIGYLPADRTLTRQFLDSRDATYEEERQTGLFVEDEQGTLFDRFNDRVMFPLKDAFGAVVGFSGRVLDPDAPGAKYLNSPETALFNKRAVLFNLDAAKNAFKDAGGAILFEGFMDVIAAWQAGVPTGIASMGTSLTTEQIGILARQTRRLTICYDGDAAGQQAAMRAVTMLAQQNRLEVAVTVLPNGQDPDEFIQANGAAAFQTQVTQTLTPIGFQLNYLASEYDLTRDQDKLTYIDSALQVVAQERDPVARAVYLKQVSDLTGVPANTLEQSMPRTVAKAAPAVVIDDYGFAPPPPSEYGNEGGGQPPAAPVRYNKYEKAQRDLLHLAWQDADFARRLRSESITFADARYQQLFEAWVDYASQNADPTVAGFIDAVDDALAPVVSAIDFQELPEMSDDAIADLIARNQEASLQEELAAVKQQLHQAQQLGDQPAVAKLTMQYFALTRALKAAQDA